MIRTVLFDVDGTLYDFRHADGLAVGDLKAYAAEHFGWSAEEYTERQQAAMADIGRYAGTSGGYRSREVRYQNMLERAGLPLFPHAREMSRIYMETLISNMIPEEGAAEWIRALRAEGRRIGFASDATAFMQLRKLVKLDLLRYFDFAVTAEETAVEKPDPRFFSRCLEKCGCAPEEILFIGDHYEKDYLGAKAAGFHAVWYNPHQEAKREDDVVLRAYSRAPALLRKLEDEAGKEEL